MADDEIQITIRQQLPDRERQAAEKAAAEAVARVRAEEASRTCPVCRADVARVAEYNIAAVGQGRSLLLAPNPVIADGEDFYLRAAGGTTVNRVGRGVAVHALHRCPTSQEEDPS